MPLSCSACLPLPLQEASPYVPIVQGMSDCVERAPVKIDNLQSTAADRHQCNLVHLMQVQNGTE